MSLVEGQKFAGYTIVRRLGAGGMGEVYLTQHPRLPRRDALKVLPATVSADAEYRARFEREADLASTLWHPHIVGVHDRGEADGQLWLSMDFVDGHDAAHLIADHYPTGMPAADVVEIVTALASALDYAHQQGLLHRDVKPANIMLTNPGEDGTRRILLTDFGIARAMDDVSGLTATNMTVGTVDYCAPEQLMGDPVDGRTDQYALAATAYHLLTGTTLFPHTNPTAVIGRHLTCAPPRLGQARPELSAADPVLAAALAKEPEDRFARCSDFARALAEQIAPPQRTGAGPTTPAAVAPRFRTAPSNVGTGRPIQPTTQRRPLIAGPSAAGNATSSRRPTAMLVSAGATVLILAVVAAVMWWRPWAPTHQQHATATTTTPAPAPATSAPPPQPAAPSTPVPTAPPPAPDPYTYALPGCYFNGEAPQERPTVQPFQTCADGSRQLEDMTWSSWGKDGAQGTGVFSFNVCEPSCAQGHRAQFAVSVTASNPTPAGPNSGCPIDVRFYSDMIVAFTNTAPSPTEMPIDSTYLGRPAIRFTNSPNASGNGNLGNQLCY